MQYKIVSLRVKNFKCFDNSRYYEFSIDYDRNPIILSGPNGFGKTTFFDAVELIFSKNITRLDKAIEKKTTNLGKNILLNKADEDGYVVLTLENKKNEYLTLFARISNANHKLEVENAIDYGEIKEYIMTNKLNDFLLEYDDWKESVDSRNLIKYRENNFNVYYYVSQAESVHFLKRTITDRKDAMNVLLNTGVIDTRKEIVINLIGKKINTSGYLINDELISLDQRIKEKIGKLKKLLKDNVSEKIIKNKFIDLGLYKIDSSLFFWDNPNISECNVVEIRNGKNELTSLISFIENEDDYRNYIWNTEIEKIIQGKAINDYVKYGKYIIDSKVSKENIQADINRWDSIIQIYNRSLFFRQEVLDIGNYKEEDISKLKELVPELCDYNFSLISNIVSEIINLKNTLSTSQKVIGRLTSARKSLQSARNEYDAKGTICPFCNTKFSDAKVLKKGFEEIDKLLRNESGSAIKRIESKNEELAHIIKPVQEILKIYINTLDNNSVDLLIQGKVQLQGFINDIGRVTNTEKVGKYLIDESFDQGIDNDKMIIEIQRIISGLIREIKNIEFENLYNLYQYNKMEQRYGEKYDVVKSKYSKDVLKKKCSYLEGIIWEKDNAEIHDLRAEVKDMIVRREQVFVIRNQFNKLVKQYDLAIEEYKNMTLKKLRVPLLIYTGKILQDYQSGLGVFINKDEMRFVSNGDAKHDILNTFSSGQLSGFVLAFLFAMNKQYIKSSSDDIGFILIDDPVQTMDDINISSLIEVLRNDFSEKQIILSTHEVDKENYILYKFYKYNQLGQSFNVKEDIYGS